MSDVTPGSAVWDSLTHHRGKGESIARLVEPFFAGELSLAPPLADLDARIAVVREGLRLPESRTVCQSVEDAAAPIAHMHIGEAERFIGGLCGLLTGCISMPIGRRIDAVFRPRAMANMDAKSCMRQVGDYVLTCLVAARPNTPSIGTQFLRAMHGEASIRTTAYFLALAAAFDLEDREVLGVIASLYLEGNFPIGLQRDDAFVVLVK